MFRESIEDQKKDVGTKTAPNNRERGRKFSMVPEGPIRLCNWLF